MTSADRPQPPQANSASAEGKDLRARRDQVEAIVEEFADIHPPNYLDDLRGEWPE